MSNLPFPEKILHQHIAVLGKTGSGKSSALRVLAEHLLDKKRRAGRENQAQAKDKNRMTPFKDPRSRTLWRTGRVILKGQDMTDLRRQVYKRAGGRCEVIKHGKRCNRFAPWDGYQHGELAHVLARGRTGSDTAENTCWSCHACHRQELHRGPQFAAERRRREALGPNRARPGQSFHGDGARR